MTRISDFPFPISALRHVEIARLIPMQATVRAGCASILNGLNDFRHFGQARPQAILELPEAAQGPMLSSLFQFEMDSVGQLRQDRVTAFSPLESRGRPHAPRGVGVVEVLPQSSKSMRMGSSCKGILK
jgi:hypothetical protein